MIDFNRLYQSGMTTRYHTDRQEVQHRVDSHAWGVASFILAHHPEPSVELIKAALWHDSAERRGPGDIRFQAKRDYPDLREAYEVAELDEFERLGVEWNLTKEDMDWLKFADMAEVVMHVGFILRDLGYPFVENIFITGMTHLLNHPRFEEVRLNQEVQMWMAQWAGFWKNLEARG